MAIKVFSLSWYKKLLLPAWLARRILRILGWLSLTLALTMSLLVLWPMAKAVLVLQLENFKAIIQKEQSIFRTNSQRESKNENREESARVVFSPEEFRLKITKIGLDTKVLPEVDAADPQSYGPALKQGVAQAAGTAFPGQGKLVYVFGHSTNYEWFVAELNAVFYKLADLEIGDQIEVSQGDKKIAYETVEKKILEADENDFIQDNLDKDWLVLQTCYPPGTTWKRLIVIARPQET